ncbi:MAG: hypothetical protein HQM10_18200 [Candidatus Riflebacteria bacterium]|nr:hypothetical protein [Candidatus Riflebacteria bacterium]
MEENENIEQNNTTEEANENATGKSNADLQIENVQKDGVISLFEKSIDWNILFLGMIFVFLLMTAFF